MTASLQRDKLLGTETIVIHACVPLLPAQLAYARGHALQRGSQGPLCNLTLYKADVGGQWTFYLAVN